MGVRIKDLATRAAKLITGNAWLIVDDGGSNVNKIDYKELAKQIIEEYNTSSLGGSAQTVKSAIDALNSNTYKLKGATSLSNGTDLNAITTPGSYKSASASVSATLVHAPVTNMGFIMSVEEGNNSNAIIQKVVTRGIEVNTFVRSATYSNAVWTYDSEWVKVPTRTEMDAVNDTTKKYRFTNISASSTDNLVQLGAIANYGVMLAVLRVDNASDGASAYIVRRNSAGWQVSALYEGESTTTPIIDSNGILKLKSSGSGATVHGFVITFAKWS